ncbi:MAG: alanine--tRNA ligase, partial [Tenericutes bacterium]|nr:alanine--tRNA ligase [Mycoplasmatota bacterium]
GRVKDLSGNALKQVVDDLAANLEDGLVLLASELGNKVIFVCKSKSAEFNAGKLVKEAAIICNGNGGGRPDFAQAGGKDASKIDLALTRIKELVL